MGPGASMELHLGLFCCSSCPAATAVTAKDTSVAAPEGGCWVREATAGGTTACFLPVASRVSVPSMAPRSQATHQAGAQGLDARDCPARPALKPRTRQLTVTCQNTWSSRFELSRGALEN